MSGSGSRVGARLSRIGAVGLALAVLGYLVVSAQRRANPGTAAGRAGTAPDRDESDAASPSGVARDPVVVESVAGALEAGGSSDAPDLFPPGAFSANGLPAAPLYLPSSKALVLESGLASDASDPAFLFSSKSGAVIEALRADAAREAVSTTAPVPAAPATPPVYLPSSKVLKLTLPTSEAPAAAPRPKPPSGPN